MALPIFVGWDSRFPEPALVLAHSIRKHTSIPVAIHFLDYRHLQDCYGFNRAYDPKATTEFTYSRFLVPHLCGYDGVAIFMDNDLVCLSDIAELVRGCTTQLLKDAATLLVRKHEQQAVDGAPKMYGAKQTAYPRKNWSSLMVMDCAKLKLWTKPVVETASGAYLHRFQDIPDAQIGEVPDGWNDLEDQYRPGITKLLHWTEGGPWYEECRDCPHAEVWLQARRDWLISEGRDPLTPLPPVAA